MTGAVVNLLQGVEATAFFTEIRESSWMFPTIETVHVLALVFVIGTIFNVDLRLLGVHQVSRPFSAIASQLLPWTAGAFAVTALAGLLMFGAKATTYAANVPFRIKLCAILLAGLNMFIFHLVSARGQLDWDVGVPPLRAKLAGGFSLILWIVVVAAGRWVGFTT